ncbi:MAG: bromoperoxidase, partial [Pseudomonadota bacterium]
MPKDRAEEAYRVRVEAAAMARNRTHPVHEANGDEERYSAVHYPMNFTKGLKHDPKTGLVADTYHFEAYRSAIDAGHIEDFTTRVPVPTTPHGHKKPCDRRKWEAPTAGIVYDLEGPDAQAVTMPPAPALCSDELAFEMAEVYELALLRDVPLASFDHDGGDGSSKINGSVGRLNKLPYAEAGFPGRPRVTDDDGELDRQTVFRGSSPGVENGPYLSQFMLIGNGKTTAEMEKGKITYGAQQIDQKVPMAKEELDYMQLWNDWLTVQDGFDVNKCGLGRENPKCSP